VEAANWMVRFVIREEEWAGRSGRIKGSSCKKSIRVPEHQLSISIE